VGESVPQAAAASDHFPLIAVISDVTAPET